jgi:hypothetical protein
MESGEGTVTCNYTCEDENCVWYDVTQETPTCMGCQQRIDLTKLEGNTLNNLEKKIRSQAKKAAKTDNSGHGRSKKIHSGHSKDRHEGGQDRQVQHYSAKTDALEAALHEFQSSGGKESDLETSTIKLLNKARKNWRDMFSNSN